MKTIVVAYLLVRKESWSNVQSYRSAHQIHRLNLERLKLEWPNLERLNLEWTEPQMDWTSNGLNLE